MLEQDQGIRLAVRIGIHTGPVVVGEVGTGTRQEQLALGETPNIAARIQGLSEPDTVVISSTTYWLIQGYFDCESLDEHVLRGVSQPIVVYRVLQASEVQNRLDVASARGLIPLVGRESEVTLLLERWRQVKDGQGQVVLLSGEAGIGKSRLLQVLRDQLRNEPHTRQECRCSPYHINSAFFPLTELLQRKLGWQPEDSPAIKLHKLEMVLSQTYLDVNAAVPLFTGLLSLPLSDDRYPPIQLSSQQQRQHTLEAFLQLVLLAAEQHPVLFIVEDLHWIDPSTLEFLNLLINQTPTAAILVLLTCRPEFQPPWSHRSYLTEITLSRLSQSHIEQMVKRVTGGKSLPAVVLQQIVEKTDGVPLVVEELTKALLESGYLSEIDGHYELTGALPALAIPPTLQDSLMARLDRLMTAKMIAQLGATIGRTFSYELLRAMASVDEDTLQRELSRLVEAELIYQRGVIPQATYIFKHTLIQDTAYESLLRSTRQGYHRRIAEVLEERFPETAETQPELLAYHYTEAGLDEQAVNYWYKAAQQSTQRSANVEAITHLHKGLETLQDLPDSRQHSHHELKILIALGQAYTATTGFTSVEMKQAYTRAWELCQELGETDHVFLVLLGLRRFHTMRAEFQRVLELREQLLALANDIQDSTLLMMAHDALGRHAYNVGKLKNAYKHFNQVKILYDRHAHRSLALRFGQDPCVDALTFGALSLWYLGYPDQARTYCTEAIELGRELAHPFSLVASISRSAVVLAYCRQVREAQVWIEEALILAQEQGFSQWIAWQTILRGWTLAKQGCGDKGIETMHQGLSDFKATRAETGLPRWLSLLTEVCMANYWIEEGFTHLAEAQRLVSKNDDHTHEPEIYRLKGELLLSQSPENHAEAVMCFYQALDIACSQHAKSLELRAATSLARLWQSQGKREEARELLEPVYSWFTEGFDTADLIDAKTLLDELLA